MKRILLALCIISFNSSSYAGLFDIVNIIIDKNKTTEKVEVGTPKDIDKFNKTRKLAEQGDASSQSYLGWMYNTGIGVKRDNKKAVEWYTKSAEQENAIGQYNLGLMYRLGQGVLKNNNTAVYWYEKSAEQGRAEAQYSLGMLYIDNYWATKKTQKIIDNNSFLGILYKDIKENIHIPSVKNKRMVVAKYWIKKAYENTNEEISKKAKDVWNSYELWKY